MAKQIGIEVVYSKGGQVLNLVSVPLKTIFEIKGNREGYFYCQVMDGKPVAVFKKNEFFIVDIEGE